jgi:hypothetical protein
LLKELFVESGNSGFMAGTGYSGFAKRANSFATWQQTRHPVTLEEVSNHNKDSKVMATAPASSINSLGFSCFIASIYFGIRNGSHPETRVHTPNGYLSSH